VGAAHRASRLRSPSVPVVDLHVSRRRTSPPALYQLPQTQEEGRPLHTAVGRELDRFTPVPMTEQEDRVPVLFGEVERHIGPDPLRGASGDAPTHAPPGGEVQHLEVHPTLL